MTHEEIERELESLRSDLVRLTKASARACERRSALPPGSSRARVTTANARWALAAEARDRCQERIEKLEAELAAELVTK